MMRLSIVVDDSMVSIDGVAYFGIDLSFIPANIHAVQWYGSHGEIEVIDTETKKIVSNDAIQSVEDFQPAIDAWNQISLSQATFTQPSEYP